MPQHKDALADYTTDRSVLVLSAIALVIGAIASVVALVLLDLIQFFTNLCFYQKWSIQQVSPAGNHIGLWVILVPAVGGLVIGYMARYGSDKIRGHGIPEALESILIGQSKMEPKVAALKPLSSAISIGTGGPYGAEGPIIMTAGAIGSLIAQFIHLSSAERKTLLVAGAAAGMAAIFGTPVAAVLLAVELLLFEWKPRSFIPCAVASITAAACRPLMLGAGPIFPIAPHGDMDIKMILCAAGVGLVAGGASCILTTLVYFFEDMFRKLPIHWMWWPAIGGLVVGLGGYIDPRVLGVGYDVIHSLLNGQVLGTAVLGILIGKSLVWSLSLGSGTSGGVLAPLLMVGAALGALESSIIPVGNPSLWAAISMAAVMGGTMRAPFTALVFALEVTHDLNILPGLLTGCMVSMAVAVLIMKRSILSEKVARRGHHLIYEYGIDPLTIHRVSEVMVRNIPTILMDMTVENLFKNMALGEQVMIRNEGAPLVDASGKLTGVITQSDVLRALHEGKGDWPVSKIGTLDPIVITEEDLLSDAAIKMLSHNIGRLPVVDEKDPEKLVGYIDRSHLMAGRVNWFEEEHERGQSWRVPGLGSKLAFGVHGPIGHDESGDGHAGH